MTNSKANPARAAILSAVRHSLNRQGPMHEAVTEPLQQRLNNPPTGIQPAFEEDLVERFQQKVAVSGATSERFESMAEVNAGVRAYLQGEGLPARLALSVEPVIQDLDWQGFELAQVSTLKKDHGISVTSAEIAIAESGTIMVLSGPHQHSHLFLLAETHIVILRQDQFVKHIEAVSDRIRCSRFRAPQGSVRVASTPCSR